MWFKKKTYPHSKKKKPNFAGVYAGPEPDPNVGIALVYAAPAPGEKDQQFFEVYAGPVMEGDDRIEEVRDSDKEDLI